MTEMMKIKLWRGDITKFPCDAIVNAANPSLMGGGGVDGAIHRAAGPELDEECTELNGCKTGDAKITKGYRLPCDYIIHTVGPVWNGGGRGEAEELRRCYENSLNLAVEYGCSSLAFPSISTGVYRYPVEEAAKIAVASVVSFQNHTPQAPEVTFVCFDEETFRVYDGLLSLLQGRE